MSGKAYSGFLISYKYSAIWLFGVSSLIKVRHFVPLRKKKKNTNFYLQQLRKKNKLSNIYVIFSALEEESVGHFAHPSRRARGTARASVHSSSQCLHTRGKRALGTTQCASRQHALNITINLAITKMIRNLLCPCQ